MWAGAHPPGMNRYQSFYRWGEMSRSCSSRLASTSTTRPRPESTPAHIRSRASVMAPPSRNGVGGEPSGPASRRSTAVHAECPSSVPAILCRCSSARSHMAGVSIPTGSARNDQPDPARERRNVAKPGASDTIWPDAAVAQTTGDTLRREASSLSTDAYCSHAWVCRESHGGSSRTAMGRLGRTTIVPQTSASRHSAPVGRVPTMAPETTARSAPGSCDSMASARSTLTAGGTRPPFLPARPLRLSARPTVGPCARSPTPSRPRHAEPRHII